MKKYLIRGALALVVCGCMISCQDHDEFVGNVIQAKTQAFDETFVEAYGEIQAGHDWGFGSVGQALRTRSEDANNNMWYTYEGITIPSPITAAERKAVADLFSEEHREACTVTIDLTNFFIQQDIDQRYIVCDISLVRNLMNYSSFSCLLIRSSSKSSNSFPKYSSNSSGS